MGVEWTIGVRARRGEGGGEHASERTPRCVSERAQAATPASAARGAADIKNPLAEGARSRIDISRVAPPIVRRIAIVWSLGRLTGRPMRPESAIADLLIPRHRPLLVRTGGV